jgi:hypothetical protein
VKTTLQFHGRGMHLFHMHPFNVMFSVIASFVLMLLLTVLIVLSVK